MFRFRLVAAALAVALLAGPLGLTVRPAAGASSTHTAAYAQLQALARHMTFDWAQRHPIVATELGLTERDGELETPSAANRVADLAQIRAWQATLAAIPLARTTLVERDDALLLKADLLSRERALTVYRTDEKDYAAPARAILGVLFTQFLHLPTPGEAGATKADRVKAWSRILSRMQKAPAYIVAGQKLVTHPGHLFGVVGAQELAGGPEFIEGPLTAAAKAQLAPAQFAAFLKARSALVKTMQATTSYIKSHLASWPENYAIGRSAYDAMLHDEQLLPYNADDIRRMGEDELAHGWAEQVWLEQLARVHGTSLGAATGGGMAPSGKAIIGYYRDLLAQLNDFVKRTRVITIPAWLGDVQVVETPKFLQPVQPGASINPPRVFAKETTGFYFITPPKSLAAAAKRLDLYQDFDRDRIWSTAGHEAMPGHYLQFSIARRHPDFVRKTSGSGAFSEGWAYYGEEMLMQLGLYGEDLDGRLDIAQWERIRGARAIVDAELASGDWSYRRAANYFARETGATQGQADAAVAGIALGPGDVISYTVGRFQLENLMTEYRHRLGARASMHDFHDRLLSYGSVPFAIVGPELLADLGKTSERVRAAANY
jgi:uncharacterized protein (DUF885 family)